MISGKITTEEYADGSKLHRGQCTVKRESITAGEVMSQQIPDGPPKGFVRSTRFWRNTQEGDGSQCEFEIEDKRIET